MSEPFDPVKLIASPFTGLYWVKVVMLGLGLIALYTGYKFVMKPSASSNQAAQNITNYTYEMKPNIGGCATVRAGNNK